MEMDVDMKVNSKALGRSLVPITGDNWERLRCVEFLAYCQENWEPEM